MRSKEEILAESLKQAPQVPAWDATASLHERLTIEVLIDIRDILNQFIQEDKVIQNPGAEGSLTLLI